MATVVQGCNSPRQQHHCGDLNAGGGVSGCLSSVGHHSQHQLQGATPMYSSLSKYPRPTAMQTHIYEGGSGGAGSSSLQQVSQIYATPSPSSYLSMTAAAGVNSVGTQLSPPTGFHHTYNPSSSASAAKLAAALPEACRNYTWSHAQAQTLATLRNGRSSSGNNTNNNSMHKRKTAVQLLAESKPFYMKADSILDRLQQQQQQQQKQQQHHQQHSTLNYRRSILASGGSIGVKRNRSSISSNRDQLKFNTLKSHSLAAHDAELDCRYATTQRTQGLNLRDSTLHSSRRHHHHSGHNDRQSAVSAVAGASSATAASSSVNRNNPLLESKLKMFFNADVVGSRSRSVGTSTLLNSHTLNEDSYQSELQRKFDLRSAVNPPSSLLDRKELPMVSFVDQNEVMPLPPPLFLSSSEIYDEYCDRDNSSIDDPLILTDDYRPISPPAEYAADSSADNNDARSRCNYQRSYSHSHDMSDDKVKYNINSYNINSHKSLPDLHTQINRHSPHSEILSCCSRGNRSIKSAGESSLNRDSGGSSGHYTHRSEPCYRRGESQQELLKEIQNCCKHGTPMEYRRDSGSSTQHSANSYCGGYASPTHYRSAGLSGSGVGISGASALDCAACRCKPSTQTNMTEYFFDYGTPEVPEAFQDDYTPPSPTQQLQQQQAQGSHFPKLGLMKLSKSSLYSSSAGTTTTQQQQLSYCSSPLQQQQSSSQHASIQSPGSAPSMEDISPPPIQFKRQKCIRYKNRSRLPGTINSSLCNVTQTINDNNIETTQIGNYAQPMQHQQQQHHMSQLQQHHHPQQQSHQTQTNFFFPKYISASDEFNTTSRGSRIYAECNRRLSCDKIPIGGLSQDEFDHNKHQQQLYFQYHGNSGIGIGHHSSNSALNRDEDGRIVADDGLSELEKFFDRLGLNDEKYHEIYTTARNRRHSDASGSGSSGTVFFSDVSTVDSMRLPDSTETQAQMTQPYRPSEPPSIVERNARIIKWLCNIKKLEYS